MSEFQPQYNTLVEIYDNSVRTYPDRPLFGVKRGGSWQWMTYREFGDRVEKVRGGLAQLGVDKGDRVAIIANNRPEWAIAAYASYGRGASFVPMYEYQHDEDWKYILADSEAKVLVVANQSICDRVANFRDELPALEHVVVLDGDATERGMGWQQLLDKGAETPSEEVRPDPSDIAGFIYTSGTTGNPKGVLLSHKNMANNVSCVLDLFPMGPDDRSLSFLPWAHSFGQVVELHGLFAWGASMGIAESTNKIIENLSEVRPTLLFSVPRIFNRIYDGLNKKMNEAGGLKKKLFDAGLANEQYRKKLAAEGRTSAAAELKHKMFDKLVFSKVRERFGGRLRYAFSGGAAIDREVAEFIDNLGIMVYEGYGLTETSPIATANWPGSRRIGSIGKPVPGVRVEIDTEATGDPKQGEVVIYGHNVMQGYHNLPEENEKVFTSEGGFRTGDMGYRDEGGFVYITGRVKEQYKLENGKYVVPTPLEEKLKLSPYIANVMVYGENRPYNVALIIPDEAALEKWASEQGLDPSDLRSLVQHPKVHELYSQEIDEWSKGFKSFERIRDFTLGVEDFTTDNGMLTPTLKLKRRVVIDHYGEQIRRLYEEGKKAQSAA
jgi:long-chain acyl-CoA synthetase